MSLTHGVVIALRLRPRFWGFIFAFEGLRVLTHALHCARLQHATLARVAMATRYTAFLSEIPPNSLHHAWLTLSIASRLQYRCIDFCGQNWYLHLLLMYVYVSICICMRGRLLRHHYKMNTFGLLKIFLSDPPWKVLVELPMKSLWYRPPLMKSVGNTPPWNV